MDETVSSRPRRKAAAEYRAELEEIFREMDRLDEQMERDRQRSIRLKAETEVILEQIDAKLDWIRRRLDAAHAAS